MKTLYLIVACVMSLTLSAQQATNAKLSHSATELDSLELFFSFPCIAFDGEYGIEEDYHDDEIYVTQWSGDSIAKYDMEGNLIDEFIIPGVSQIRDLAYDGEFFYGGSNDTILYVMDFITKTLVIAVDMPFKIQGIAFDKWDEIFWVCEEGSPIVYQIDAWGANLGYITIDWFDTINITGLAFCEYYYTDPYLWVFCQDSSRSLLIKYDIYAQHQVGYEIDLSSLVSGNAQAGGLYFREDFNYSYIGGLIQDQLVFALDLDYANQLVGSHENIIPEFNIYPNPAKDIVRITTSYKVNQHIGCIIMDQAGKLLYECKLTSNTHDIDISKFPKGAYFVQLSGSEGYCFTKKLIK